MINWEELVRFVREKHVDHPFAGYDHVERVHNLCLELAQYYDADQDVLRAAAYLHDIAVPVFGPDKHNERAHEVAGDLLKTIGFPSEKEPSVFSAIQTHSRYYELSPESIEAKILRDADGIDYLGAVGILRGVARSFKNASYKGNVSAGGIGFLNGLVDTVEGTFSTERGLEIAKSRIQFIKNYIEDLRRELGNAKG